MALIIGALLLLGLVGTSAWLAMSNRRGLERAAHTRAVLSALNDVSIRVVDAETGQRGYLLTGKDDYLAPYRAAMDELPQATATASNELGPKSPLLPRFAALRGLVDQKMAELARTVALAQSGRHDEATALVQTDQGKNTMDRIRVAYQALRTDQLAAFLSELDGVDARGRAAVAVNAAGLVGIAVMALAVARSLGRTLRRLRQAQVALGESNSELSVLNAELERRVAERTAELTEASEEIQRFAYIVSHDLRAPLVNIMGFTAELEAATGLLGRSMAALGDKGDVSEDVRLAASEDLPEAIRFIKASTSKMDRLIGAILKLSREGRRVLTSETLDMGALFAGIAESLQHQTQEAGAQIEIGPVPDIRGDRLVVEQIFGNLIDNALKYLQPGQPGRIRISGETRGGRAVYLVADNGRGIAERDRDRVFELFRRAGDQSVPGEGIGLAHVKALVRRMGGRIDLDSRPGEGTTFRVLLPGVATMNRGATG